VRAVLDVWTELHEIAPPRHTLLHHDGIGAAWQRGACHDAMRGVWNEHARRVARTRPAGDGKDKRNALPAGHAQRISVHRRLVEWRKGARRRDGRGQDALGSSAQWHVLPATRFLAI
jgi:hypothetical protein